MYQKIKERLEQSLTQAPTKPLLDYITHGNQEEKEYRQFLICFTDMKDSIKSCIKMCDKEISKK
tara:strand:+ start:72 stop:263 length:192 start_codon:yes stop_codon:yes gene_type:complete